MLPQNMVVFLNRRASDRKLHLFSYASCRPHSASREKGLVVIGFYHHKGRTPLDPAEVKRSAQRLGFRFPVAIDDGWRTLRRWWLDGGDRGWTSVTFLIDRKGVIRHIHPGGKYVKGDRAYKALRGKIEELLREE